jgi:hypothetical protein
LSSRFIEPKSAPSWKRTPNFLRISNSSSSCMLGTDSPWTRMSPSSGYSSPTMCLMHTDLPGARRAEDHRDLPLGDAHVQAAQDLVAPEGLVDVDELDRVGGAGRPVEPRVPAELVVVGALGLVDHRHALGVPRRFAVCLRVRPALLLVARQIFLAQRLLGVLVGGPSLVFHAFSLRSGLSGWHPRTAACRASR